MKFTLRSLALLVLLLALLSSCAEDSCTDSFSYIKYTPVYEPLQDLRDKVDVSAPRELKQPGKIFSYGSLLYISDAQGGVHIIDNSDPSAPQPISFLNIPGAHDMLGTDNYLYVDNYTDLLVWDVSDPRSPVLVHTEESVFNDIYQIRNSSIAISYIEEEVDETVDCSSWPSIIMEDDIVFISPLASSLENSQSPISNNSVLQATAGLGGSFARFAQKDEVLYTVGDLSLHAIDISTPDDPKEVSRSHVGWAIETVYAFKEYLFIGGRVDMTIYDISDRYSPTARGKFWHSRACDPVFPVDNRAYVTLNSAGTCPDGIDRLDILDITDIDNPARVVSYNMESPHGLSIRGDILYLCEGAYGWKIYDLSDELDIKLLSHTEGHSYDVLSVGDDLLIIIGKDGLYQYDPSILERPRLLSFMPISQ